MVHAIGEINNKLVRSFLCVRAMIITEEHSHYTDRFSPEYSAELLEHEWDVE